MTPRAVWLLGLLNRAAFGLVVAVTFMDLPFRLFVLVLLATATIAVTERLQEAAAKPRR